MSKEKPAWKKLITKSGEKSSSSRSINKYSPKRSSELFEEEKDLFSLPILRQNRNQNQSMMLNMDAPVSQVKLHSQIGRNETSNSFSDRLINQILPFAPKNDLGSVKRESRLSMIVKDTSEGLNARRVQNKPRNADKFSIFESAQLDIDLNASVQQNFRECLKFIEKIEKEFRDQRLYIERELLSKQEELKGMRNMILQTYAEKQITFKDPELNKVMDKFNVEKNKSAPKQLIRIKSVDVLNPNIIGTMRQKKRTATRRFDEDQELKSMVSEMKSKKSVISGKSGKSGKSGRSGRSKASEMCKDKFGRIMSSLQQMRKGLTEYRQTKLSSPRMNFKNLLKPSSSQQI